MEFVLTLAIAALLGLIPANIAKNKGHSFGLWWFYGWMLFIVAIIHVNFIEDRNAVPQAPTKNPQAGVADELKKYHELLQNGTITEDEYMKKKNQLLNL